MNRFLPITLAVAVAGCVSHSATDLIFDGGLDPTIYYVDGYWTPLDAGAQVITFSLPDYGRKMDVEASEWALTKTPHWDFQCVSF